MTIARCKMAIKQGGRIRSNPSGIVVKLWQNDGESTDFVAQSVELPQDITNFDKIRFEVYPSTAQFPQPGQQVVYPPERYDIPSSTLEYYITEGSGKYKIAFCYQYDSGTTYVRLAEFRREEVEVEGNTVEKSLIYFYAAKKYGGTTNSNANLIPYAIYGIVD